jgi:hypothetical protein
LTPDLPWLSKIPRPVIENPDGNRLKPATSTGNLFVESQQKIQQVQKLTKLFFPRH